MRAERLRGVIALLLFLSAALFAVGTTIERNHRTESHHVEATPSSSESGAETGSQGSTSEGSTSVDTGNEGSVLGLDLESPWLIAAAVALSIGLAIAVLRSRRNVTIACVIAAGALFALLDIREAVHQMNESNGGLVTVSVAVAAMHLAIAGLGVALLERRGSQVEMPVD